MLKRIICFGAALMIGMCIFCGCGKEPLWTFYTLQEAYDEGLLSVEDLKSIAYYHHNGRQPIFDEVNGWIYVGVEEGFVPTPKQPEKLNKQSENKMLKTWVTDYNSKHTESIKISNLFVERYYGTYNDCFAVIFDEKDSYTSGISEFGEIANVSFVQNSNNPIQIWKENN